MPKDNASKKSKITYAELDPNFDCTKLKNDIYGGYPFNLEGIISDKKQFANVDNYVIYYAIEYIQKNNPNVYDQYSDRFNEMKKKCLYTDSNKNVISNFNQYDYVLILIHDHVDKAKLQRLREEGFEKAFKQFPELKEKLHQAYESNFSLTTILLNVYKKLFLNKKPNPQENLTSYEQITQVVKKQEKPVIAAANSAESKDNEKTNTDHTSTMFKQNENTASQKTAIQQIVELLALKSANYDKNTGHLTLQFVNKEDYDAFKKEIKERKNDQQNPQKFLFVRPGRKSYKLHVTTSENIINNFVKEPSKRFKISNFDETTIIQNLIENPSYSKNAPSEIDAKNAEAKDSKNTSTNNTTSMFKQIEKTAPQKTAIQQIVELLGIESADYDKITGYLTLQFLNKEEFKQFKKTNNTRKNDKQNSGKIIEKFSQSEGVPYQIHITCSENIIYNFIEEPSKHFNISNFDKKTIIQNLIENPSYSKNTPSTTVEKNTKTKLKK